MLTPTNTAYTLHADAVAICTGLHVTPAWPDIPGIEFVPEVMHSSQYKGREQLIGKRVMVLGCGETAMDIAYESCKAGAQEVVLCHRGGYLSIPKILNSVRIFGIRFDGNLPIDGLVTVSITKL
jgi:dimethylaniline monooxygenase (N-oxide forming)